MSEIQLQFEAPLDFRAGTRIGSFEHDVILLGVRHGTLVIRKMPVLPIDAGGDGDQARREAERVIQSFRFHS